jgi:hypothetical protein
MFHNDLILTQLFSNIFINDLLYAIAYSVYVLFASDINIFNTTEHPNDCSLLQQILVGVLLT